jgi:hypothetical protein
MPRRRWVGTALVIVTVLAAVGGLMAGLRHLDGVARRHIGPRDRYEVHVADIDCDTPVGMDRRTFLAEVRYVANLPESVHLLTDGDRDRLKAAFHLHPWVEGVGDVLLEPPGRVRIIGLRFRVPILVVPTEGGVRLVDDGGLLLPISPVPADLPQLVNRVRTPDTAVGHVWTDPMVQRAVELVKAYRPHRLEKTTGGWRLTRHDGKALMVGE